jgi:hypothetical protein
VGDTLLILDDLDVSNVDNWFDVLATWLDGLRARGFSTVLFGNIVSQEQQLDALTLLGALASSVVDLRLGVVGTLGDGRSASVMAREITTLDHLLAKGTALILKSNDPSRLAAGRDVVVALARDDRATAGSGDEVVLDAPNLPRARNGEPLLGIWNGSGEGVIEIQDLLNGSSRESVPLVEMTMTEFQESEKLKTGLAVRLVGTGRGSVDLRDAIKSVSK